MNRMPLAISLKEENNQSVNNRVCRCANRRLSVGYFASTHSQQTRRQTHLSIFTLYEQSRRSTGSSSRRHTNGSRRKSTLDYYPTSDVRSINFARGQPTSECQRSEQQQKSDSLEIFSVAVVLLCRTSPPPRTAERSFNQSG